MVWLSETETKQKPYPKEVGGKLQFGSMAVFDLAGVGALLESFTEANIPQMKNSCEEMPSVLNLVIREIEVAHC